MNLLFCLFRVHHWGFRDLRELWEDRSAWKEIFEAFAACDYELRQEGR